MAANWYWVTTEMGAVYCNGDKPYGYRTQGEVIRCIDLAALDPYYTCRVKGIVVRMGVPTKEEACKYVETVAALRGDGG